MLSPLERLKHALEMWKVGQLTDDPILFHQGARAIKFWRDMEKAGEYSAKVTSEGTK